jgi:DNA-binding helix-hairpin-helix protein with protein kinase domain
VPDFRLRPFPGIQVVYEQGRAGERDIADGMFTPAETLETAEVL